MSGVFDLPLGVVSGVLAILALITWHCWWLSQRGRWLALDPLNFLWAGVVVIYVVQATEYSEVLSELYGRDHLVRSMAVVFAGLVAVVVGYESRLGGVLAKKVPNTPFRLSPPRLRLVSLGLIGVGVLGYAYQFSSAGGFVSWIAVARGGTDWEAIENWVAQAADVLPIGVAVLLLHAEMHHTRRGMRVVAWSAWLGMFLWLFYLGTRSRVIVMTIGGIAAFYLPRRRNPPGWLLGVAFLILLFLTGFQAAFRGTFRDLRIDVAGISGEELRGASLPSMLGGDRTIQQERFAGGLEMNCVLAAIALVPDTVPFNFGYGYLEFFTRPIPRSLWASKWYPMRESLQGVFRLGGLTEAQDPNTGLLSGPAFTLIGHWYYAGGLVGVIIGGFLAGGLCRGIRGIWERRPTSEGDLLLFCQLMAVGFGEVAGTPLGFVFSLPPIVVALSIAFVLCREPAR